MSKVRQSQRFGDGRTAAATNWSAVLLLAALLPADNLTAQSGSVLPPLNSASVQRPDDRRAGTDVPQGHLRLVAVPFATVVPTIDGNIDEQAWLHAAFTSAFWISEYQQAPRETTEVRLLTDASTLYIAFTCRDSRPDQIQAEQRKRDSAFGFDDHVSIQLDPYHNHRLISSFSVNARGTQSDEMAGGRASKIEWKGDWSAAASRTPNGWTAEIAIPFEILNYEEGSGTFGVNFVRYHHRTQETSRWADVTPRHLPEETGHLVGLPAVPATRITRLSVMPYVSGGTNAPDDNGIVRGATATGGVDVRYNVTPSFTGVASANPDFSQVEEEVIDLSFDYNEKIREERRPFFQEGRDFFGNRTYFFGGRIPNFDAGVKSFGRRDGFQIGALGVVNFDGRQDYAAHIEREVGATANIGATFIGTDRDTFGNRVVALNADGRIGRSVSFALDAARSVTDGAPGDGTLLELSTGYRTAYWQSGVTYDQTDVGFFPANGFIKGDLLGTRGGTGFIGYYQEYPRSWIRYASGSVTYEVRDTFTRLLQRRQLSIYGEGETRNHIFLSGGFTRGPYRPRDDDPGTWLANLNDDEFYTVSALFNASNERYGYGATHSWGFLDGADYSNLVPSLWLRPTHTTTLSYSYDRSDFIDRTTQGTLTGSWEITPVQVISGRWVRADRDFYRLAYRRTVRRGLDIFAVYNDDPFNPDQFTFKIVRTFQPLF